MVSISDVFLGYKQKSVIEFTNAAAILFLERFLLSKSNL
jgi:hypothetical protein